MSINDKIVSALNQANNSWRDFMATINVFNSNIQRGDFKGAEAERLRLHTLVDDYVDQYTIAGQLSVEVSRNQGRKT